MNFKVERACRRGATMLLCLSVIVCCSNALAQTPVVVRSTEPPAWGASPKLVQELSIGAVEGDERYMFRSVRNVAVGVNGSIIVADGGQKPIVHMYDVTGKFLRNVGRDGQGPGEYREIGTLRTFKDGRIVVWDPGMNRLTTYTAAGAYSASVRIPSGLHSDDIMHVDHDGQTHVKTVTHINRITNEWQFGWIRVSPALKVLDTTASPSFQAPGSFSLAGPSGFERPFTHEVISTVLSTGALLTGDNSQFAFQLQKSGQPTVRIERTHTPVPLTARERKEWIAFANDFADARRRNPVKGQPPVVAAVIPNVKPAYRKLATDADGRIWVHKYTTATERPAPERAKGDSRPIIYMREQPTFDVFEPNGKFLGTLVLPWNSFFEDAVGMNVFVTQTGTEGEETVVRYRISPSK